MNNEIILDEVFIDGIQDECEDTVCVQDTLEEDTIDVAEIITKKENIELNSLDFIPNDGELTYSENLATFVGSFTYTTLDKPNEKVQASGSISFKINALDNIIIDSDETNSSLEIHLDQQFVTRIELLEQNKAEKEDLEQTNELLDQVQKAQAADSIAIVGLQSDVITNKENIDAIKNNYVTTDTNQTIQSNKTIIGNLTIEGNITQNGEQYITSAEKVETKDNYILMRKGATGSLGSGYSGFEVEKYDGENNGRLVIDANGIARVGDVGDEQPLLTRQEQDQLQNGEVFVWNSETNRAESSNEFAKTSEVEAAINDLSIAINNELSTKASLDYVDSKVPTKTSELENDSGFVKNTDYATKDKAGVARIFGSGDASVPGVGLTGNNILEIVAATKTDIDAKTNGSKPIVPTNLDFAVKVGLTTNKEEWTEEEKASARALLGITSGGGSGGSGSIITTNGIEQSTWETNVKLDKSFSNDTHTTTIDHDENGLKMTLHNSTDNYDELSVQLNKPTSAYIFEAKNADNTKTTRLVLDKTVLRLSQKGDSGTQNTIYIGNAIINTEFVKGDNVVQTTYTPEMNTTAHTIKVGNEFHIGQTLVGYAEDMGGVVCGLAAMKDDGTGSMLTLMESSTRIDTPALYLNGDSESNKVATLGDIPESSGTIVTVGGSAVDTFDADTKANANSVPTKTSQLENDSNFLTSVPSEYVTETELTAKNYATKSEIPDISGKADLNNSNQTITANDIILQGFSMFNYCADLGARDYIIENESNYIKWNGGLLICWGLISQSSSGTRETILPARYIDTNYICVMGCASSANSAPTDRMLGCYSKDFQKFTNYNIGNRGVYWMTIGKWK